MKLTPKTTLDEACRNPNGKTYNGAKLVQFLVYCTTGKQISDDEANTIVREAQETVSCRRK